MPFTVDDFGDLLRLLDQHPEWRSELRRHVLTDELLELPALMRQLGERVDRLAQTQERTAEQLSALTARVDALVEALEDTVGGLKGEALELRYARRAGAYFSPLARRLQVLDPARLADRLDDAVDAGQLTAGERTAVLQADVVLSGVRREDRSEIYLIVEVSAGIGRHDVERAAQRAGLLAKLGQPVLPVVAGEWIAPEAEEQARRAGVWQVLDGHAVSPTGRQSA